MCVRLAIFITNCFIFLGMRPPYNGPVPNQTPSPPAQPTQAMAPQQAPTPGSQQPQPAVVPSQRPPVCA